jgi:hypothetical protein
MQPFSIAISQPGIQYLLQTLLGAQIAGALQDNLTTPDTSFQSPDFVYWVYNNIYETDYSNINVQLTGGTFKKFAPVFTSYVQGPDDNSLFTITMNAANVEVDYTWTETFTSTRVDYTKAGKVPERPQSGGGSYPYSVVITNISITAVFRLAVGDGGYQLTYVSSTADPGNAQPNIPGNSILSLPQSGSCPFTTHVANLTTQQLANIDYGSCVARALKPIFASIADSGKLGPVEFDFLTPGDSGLVFPPGGGIQIGAAGGVTVNGVPYAAPAPPPLALPPVPTGSPPPDVAFFIQDYEVNALFWGFQAAGVLKTTLAAGNLKDPQALETNTYSGGSLNNLALKYPGLLMTADLAAREAPTVAFQTVYEFNAKNMQNIQEALGATSWGQFGNEIEGMNGMAFSSQSGLENELSLIDSALLTYAPTIEKCTGLSGVVVTHTTRCVLSVCPDKENPIPVITFDVAQTFLMDGLQLGQSSSGTGTVQSVIFTFKQPMDAFPKASFVSSTIPGVDGGDFGDVWNALRPNWQDVFGQVGTAGMPLPHIPGFDFLFSQATVAVVPAQTGADGYLSVTASMTYSAEGLTPAVRQAIARPAVVA